MPRSSLMMLAALPLLAGPALAQDQAATIATAQSDDYGTYLTDGEGRSVYMFESDRQGQGDTAASSSCGGDCATAWPPVLSQGAPAASGEATGDMLGTFDRGDGTMQVTYNGWPLYYYQEDTEPGQTNGHDIKDFGAEWYLLNAEGEEPGEEGGE